MYFTIWCFFRSVELIFKRFHDQLSKTDGKNGGTALHWARNRQVINIYLYAGK